MMNCGVKPVWMKYFMIFAKEFRTLDALDVHLGLVLQTFHLWHVD